MTSHGHGSRGHESDWAGVRAILLQLVREHEVPLFSSRMANVHRVLVIGSCLGLPLLDALHRTARDTHLALVAPNRSEVCGGVPALGAGLTAAGSLEEILLPTGWAEGILGYCVLDELQSPRAAFTELARAGATGATICLSGPALAGSSPLRVAGVRATVWPVHRLIDDLCESGFADVSTSDLTAQVVARLPQSRRAAFGFSADVRWMVLEGRRRPIHA
jgi:hypothetical protein